ncbi:hypothetical protein JCM8097_009077 [Rhodosporidiobolus ruineniae]
MPSATSAVPPRASPSSTSASTTATLKSTSPAFTPTSPFPLGNLTPDIRLAFSSRAFSNGPTAENWGDWSAEIAHAIHFADHRARAIYEGKLLPPPASADDETKENWAAGSAWLRQFYRCAAKSAFEEYAHLPAHQLREAFDRRYAGQGHQADFRTLFYDILLMNEQNDPVKLAAVQEDSYDGARRRMIRYLKYRRRLQNYYAELDPTVKACGQFMPFAALDDLFELTLSPRLLGMLKAGSPDASMAEQLNLREGFDW